MGMLNWNRDQVRKLTGGELWMFIAGRVLISIALGIWAAELFPEWSARLALPVFVLGLALFIFSVKGFFRSRE